jgi:dTDP-4-amino-4,6-dideoxygalactose transaminase
MINVTKTYLPPFEEYTRILKRAWDKAWITNNGELVQELETRLKEYLGVKHLLFCSNGTVALQMALKAYNITGEVITTPFSYVATTNAILWEKCTPVFVDIEPQTFCIDPDKIEAAITENTQSILATHVYGYPCAIEKIEAIGQKHKLKIIYDGAHAFGVLYKGSSLLGYGDISICSFHATKLFHTVEGGCVITNEDETAHKLMLYRQFGHINDDYYSVGINGKNSEFHAAMGLSVLPQINEIIRRRKEIFDYYGSALKYDLFKPSTLTNGIEYNYSYYPVIFNSEKELLKVKDNLAGNGINTRRYFYPSLNLLPYLKNAASCPVSESIAKRVLCLPSFYELSEAEQERISAIVNNG